ncbi:hypothetical protein [Conexibacter sp. SYSU D00693]|uniref:hypothetical protein n=1 Tax=Conexibacter sp. SYSU D00693 TaxID=2812560 RepID=UPI00196ACF1D|nr:hypothetical protein [Conexibacter sp. SYSU D00693]
MRMITRATVTAAFAAAAVAVPGTAQAAVPPATYACANTICAKVVDADVADGVAGAVTNSCSLVNTLVPVLCTPVPVGNPEVDVVKVGDLSLTASWRAVTHGWDGIDSNVGLKQGGAYVLALRGQH